MFLVKMRTLKTACVQWMRQPRQLSLSRLALAVAASLGLGFALSGCVNVASYTQPSLVRFIDASYIAPAVNVVVEGVTLAGNVGQGAITAYGTLPANNAALIKITEATGGAALVTTNGTLVAGHHHSVFLTDNGAAATSYTVTILEDQQVAAASGHSAFRFLNQAPKTGPIDVYMIPAGATIANTIPIVTGLAVGSTAGYISFNSQTVTMMIVPTGLLTPKYTSTSLALTGGEVRTVLVVDTQLTSDPPVEVFMADDVN
jgi:hypothetical protein